MPPPSSSSHGSFTPRDILYIVVVVIIIIRRIASVFYYFLSFLFSPAAAECAVPSVVRALCVFIARHARPANSFRHPLAAARNLLPASPDGESSAGAHEMSPRNASDDDDDDDDNII